MARIRSIKPEFPQSESMGRVSRDARLLFVQLWTLCDDSGRTRAVSRMLASLLFPYDDDAPNLIDGWLEELEREGCIVRYLVDGSAYLEIPKWLEHQRIDRPTPSKIPAFDEASRILANPREPSSLDRKGEEGRGEEGKGEGAKPRAIIAAVLQAYHEALPGCQRVNVVNPKREKRILTAHKLAEQVCRDQGWVTGALDFWRSYFAECSVDPWMRGEVPNPKNPSWKQNLDVLIAEDRFAGIMDRAIEAMREASDGR